MENSFFEYRDQSGVEVESDSDTDIVEESLLEDLMPKTPMRTNHTVIPDSEESLVYDGSEEEKDTPEAPKLAIRRSIMENHVIGSSDDDASRQSSRQSQNVPSSDVTVSSDDEEVSPELIPKRRPPTRPKSLNSTTDSPILRRVKKRMVLLDSDTDNSIIMEKNQKNKMKCLKDTPVKIDGGIDGKVNDSEESDDGNDASYADAMEHETSLNISSDKCGQSDEKSDSNDDSMDHNDGSKEKNDESGGHNDGTDDDNDVTDDDGPDEDQLVMSRATRMSIMGIIPKQNDSDESDFIESDDSVTNSIAGSTESLTDPLKAPDVATESVGSDSELPEVNLTSQTPRRQHASPVHVEKESENDNSVLTCSPIASPLRDVTKEFNNSVSISPPLSKKTQRADKALKDKVMHNILKNDLSKKTYYDGEVTVIDDENEKPMNKSNKSRYKSNTYYNGEVTVVEDSLEVNKVIKKGDDDDDVAVIDSAPEVIMLSSDEEGELNPPTAIKTSPKPIKTSPGPKPEKRDNTIRQYLPPPSYPNQVQYVQRHVLDNELSKLSGMKADLHNVKNLLDNLEVSSLPDGGSKLISRLTELEADVRRQGNRVGNMVVEPSQPTPQEIARDGFNQGLSWDDLQKASNAVQPRMFGKQAMSTHLAERNLILERLRDLHSALDTIPAEEKQAQAPAAMKTELMPHQKHALAWLRWREGLKPAGGILADDMGLGKTITMISLIAGDHETGSDGDESDDDDDDDYDERPKGKLARGGTLVVCPASLMAQWEGEVKKHCIPHRVTTCLHHGAARATQPQRLALTDIVLTTYNILQRDSEKGFEMGGRVFKSLRRRQDNYDRTSLMNGVVMRILWRRVILDEAHMVRNHKSATSRAVCGLRARRRWALTGTPLHNKDLDLFALLKFLKCTPFNDLTMWKKWIDNKTQGGQERLSTIMRCIMLRRTKTQLQAKGQLKDLPTRTAHQCHVSLTKEEMNVYQKVLVFSKTLFAQFLHQRAEKNTDGFPRQPQKESAYYEMHKKMIALQGAKPVKAHEILVLLLRLRQVCCHCGLIAAMLDEDDTGALAEDDGGKDLLAELNKLTLDESKGGDGEEAPASAERGEEGTTAAEAIRSVLSPHNPVFQLATRSSKIEAVMACLKNNVLLNKGEKAVVVSQWTSVLSLVEAELKRERVRSVTLSGSVPVPARAALVNALNDAKSDVRVMLLSLCAGGVGLNLCGASHLLLLDPHWNPQLEEQAQDRVYRVGQTRPVHVYRFMCVDTVEQSIRKLQEAKLEMAANVLTGARHNSASKLSIEDLKLLFNMGATPS